MAKSKKPDIGDLFSPTGQPPATEPQAGPRPDAASLDAVEIPATGRTFATGVGLKQSEVDMYDQLADRLGVARNKIMRYALRYFLKAYMSGAVEQDPAELLRQIVRDLD